MDIEYYMKLQNAYGTKNKREKNLAKINKHADRHFEDTFDTQDVLVNNEPMQLMIIRDTDNNTYKKKIKSRHNDIIRLGDYVKWNNQILVYNAKTNTWRSIGQIPFNAPCGEGLVYAGDSIISINGEVKPGVRSNRIYQGFIVK